MSSSNQTAFNVYDQKMRHFHEEPAAPLQNYDRILIGDVGYIWDGAFHFLFSAASPLGNRRLGEDVPESFVALDVDFVYQPRVPGCLRTMTVITRGADIGATISNAVVSPAPQLGFGQTENQGAFLATRCQTFGGFAERQGYFEDYIKVHYKSWVAFARHHGHHSDVSPILVTGTEMTQESGMLDYSNNTGNIVAETVAETSAEMPLVPLADASIWRTWSTEGPMYQNCGPRGRVPPIASNYSKSPATVSEGNDTSSSYSQCIALQYYFIRERPKVLMPEAGSYDLGSGGDSADSSLSVIAGGEDPFEEYAVFQNPPLSMDPLDCVAEYIFQNSTVTTALVHHDDLTPFFQVSEDSSTDLQSILSNHRPEISIDSDGYGRIIGSLSLNTEFSQRSVSLSSENSADNSVILPSIFSFDSQSGDSTESSQENVFGSNSLSTRNSTLTVAPWGIHYRPDAVTLNLEEYIEVPQRRPRLSTSRLVHNAGIIQFSVNGVEGFPLSDALERKYDFLDGRDDLVFSQSSSAIALRIEWPGYESWMKSIRIVDWSKDQKRRTKSRVAYDVALCISRFIFEVENKPTDQPIWRLGSGYTELGDLILVSLDQVSKGSWQPRIRRSTAGKGPATFATEHTSDRNVGFLARSNMDSSSSEGTNLTRPDTSTNFRLIRSLPAIDDPDLDEL